MLIMSANEILERIYYDVERGYGSVRSLYGEANKDGAGVSLQHVKDWVKKQTTQRRNYKNYSSYSAPYARAVYSIDIMDMISFMKDTKTFKKEYKRHAFLCIGNFSKKMHVVPMENRDGIDVYDALWSALKLWVIQVAFIQMMMGLLTPRNYRTLLKEKASNVL